LLEESTLAAGFLKQTGNDLKKILAEVRVSEPIAGTTSARFRHAHGWLGTSAMVHVPADADD
jgi:hypothetical protein